jgi:hypothetical protein
LQIVGHWRSNFKSNSSNRLNNTHGLSYKLNQDLLSTSLESRVNNSSWLYSSDNNLLNIYHQTIRGLPGKSSELISFLYPVLPHVLCLTEHHLHYSDLDHTYIDHYDLGAKYCTQITKQLNGTKFLKVKCSDNCDNVASPLKKTKDFKISYMEVFCCSLSARFPSETTQRISLKVTLRIAEIYVGGGGRGWLWFLSSVTPD